jgi:hypothetical protein
MAEILYVNTEIPQDDTGSYIKETGTNASCLAIGKNRIGIGATQKLSTLTVVGRASNASPSGIVTAEQGECTLDGTSTKFLTEVGIGDRIWVDSEERTVVSIASDILLTVDLEWSWDSEDQAYYVLPSILRAEDNAGNVPLLIKDNGNIRINGRIGMSTPEAGTLKEPAGLLQLAKSYIVAPPPTGNATTDYWSIRSAIMAVYNQVEGQNVTGTVYLQAGTYCVTFPGGDDDCIFALDVASCASGLKIIGAGRGVTVIKIDYSTAPKAVFRISDSSITIQDLSICSAQTKTHTGVKFSGGWYGAVKNVQMSNMNAGILLTGSAGFGGSCNNAFSDVLINTCNTGVQFGESGSNNVANCNTFSGGKISNNTSVGVRFLNGTSNVIYGCDMAEGTENDPNGTGVSFEGLSDNNYGNTVIGCYFEYNDADVYINSRHNKIMSCLFCSAAGHTIQWGPPPITNQNANVIFGNRFINGTPTELMLSTTIQSIGGFTVAGDEATLNLGDTFQQIKGAYHIGLVFQTFWDSNDLDSFRWKAREMGGTMHDLMTLRAYTGRLGINQENPSQKLEVGGNALIKGDNGWRVGTNDEAPLYLGDTDHSIRAIRAVGVRIGTYQNHDLIALKQSVNEGEGAVGIGQTNPSEKLEVNGKIKVAAGNHSLTLEENDIKFNRDEKSYIRNDAGPGSQIYITINSNNKMTIKGGGVDINGALEVYGNIKTSGYVDVNGPRIMSGTASPSGSVSAPKGSLYIKTNATTSTTRLWINTDSGTTWAYFTASA